MKKVVWTGLVAAMCLAGAAGAALAQQPEARRQARVERQDRIRERMEQRREVLRQRLGDERFRRLEARRRLQLDRNHDGQISRAEVRRYRSELRQALRRSSRR